MYSHKREQAQECLFCFISFAFSPIYSSFGTFPCSASYLPQFVSDLCLSPLYMPHVSSCTPTS